MMALNVKRAARSTAKQIRGQQSVLVVPDAPRTFHYATVASVQATTATITNLCGDSTQIAGVPWLGPTPVANTTVLITIDPGGSLCIIGTRQDVTPQPTTIAGGPPTTGTWSVGQTIFDTKYGLTWACTTAGTPGKWTSQGTGIVLARAWLNTAYNMPSGVDGTVIPLDTVDYDPLGMWTLGSGAEVTIPVSGTYLVEGKWETGSMVSGGRAFTNFSTNSSRHSLADKSGMAAGYQSFGGAAVIHCLSGYTIQLTAYQSTSAALPVLTGSNTTWMSVTLLQGGTQF